MTNVNNRKKLWCYIYDKIWTLNEFGLKHRATYDDNVNAVGEIVFLSPYREALDILCLNILQQKSKYWIPLYIIE